MPDTSDIGLVCFDLGRVLIRICDSWEDACRVAGVAFPDCLSCHERRGLVVELAMVYETGRMDTATFDMQMSRLLSVPRQAIDAASRAWLREPFPDIEPLLVDVKASGVATACLSNTNERHWGMMTGSTPSAAALPLHHLDHHFTSHQIGVMKPDPAIYAHVEKATQCDPSSILFFDDLADNVAAAADRGWRAYCIDSTEPPVPQMSRILREHGLI